MTTQTIKAKDLKPGMLIVTSIGTFPITRVDATKVAESRNSSRNIKGVEVFPSPLMCRHTYRNNDEVTVADEVPVGNPTLVTITEPCEAYRQGLHPPESTYIFMRPTIGHLVAKTAIEENLIVRIEGSTFIVHPSSTDMK